MLNNYLTTAFRSFRRKPGYTSINLGGLAAGMALCLVMTLYVLDEVSYDRFNTRADRMCRVIYCPAWNGNERHPSIYTPTVLAPLFRREIPEVESAVRFYDSFGSVLVAAGDKVFQEERFFFADSTVFGIFFFPLLAGQPEDVLRRPNTVVVSQSTARKYFGGGNPVGKILILNDRARFEVTGVMADVPHASHLQFDFLASFSSLERWANREIWSESNFYTYLLLRSGSDTKEIQAKADAVIEQALHVTRPLPSFNAGVLLEPLSDVYLRSAFAIRHQPKGSWSALLVVSAIALSVLFIACINYMNLATARSQQRAREVGIRKVVGAKAGHIATQFLVESGLITLVAIMIGIIAAEVALPFISDILEKPLHLNYVAKPLLLLPLGAIWLTVSLVAGSYPALFLASVRPGVVLKPLSRMAGGVPHLRKLLVVLQFAISFILIAGTVVFYCQLQFIHARQLGFDKDQVITVQISDAASLAALPTLFSELSRVHGVDNATAVNSPPVNITSGYSLWKEGAREEDGLLVTAMAVDHRFTTTLGIPIVAGTGLPEVHSGDSSWYFMLNESAARALQWTPEEAVGKRVTMSGPRKGIITGVMKDFHIRSLHNPLEPFVIFNSRKAGYTQDIRYLLVKLKPNSVPPVLTELEGIWKAVLPQRPFQFTFLDDDLDATYRAEQRLGKLVGIFAVFAVLLACLGLVALSSFMAEQRTKEIGIRKILGASVAGIIGLFSQDFLKLVSAGFVLGLPIVLYGVTAWLRNFAYRVELSWWMFALSGILALAVALMAVCVQAVKAALTNPVDALRYE